MSLEEYLEKKTLHGLDHRQIRALLDGLHLLQQQVEAVPAGEDDIPVPPERSRKPLKPGSPEAQEAQQKFLDWYRKQQASKPTVKEIEELRRLINAGTLIWSGTEGDWMG